MNLRTDMDVLDYQERGMIGELWSNKGGTRTGMDLTRPKEAYQSPLQRIGEALRMPQVGLDSTSTAIVSTAPPESQLPSGSYSPTREAPNYSYKLVAGGNLTPIRDDTVDHAVLDSGQDSDTSSDSGTIIDPATRALNQSPHNRGYFGGTSLLSSLFSNPRTRAPFKPQKSNRGTSSWQLKQYAEATLGSGSLRKAVKLPEGEDKDEWLAVNGEKCWLQHMNFAHVGC